MSTQLDTIQAPAKKATERNWQRPHYDVSENEEAFIVRVNLPGVNRKDVDISLEEDALTVTGHGRMMCQKLGAHCGVRSMPETIALACDSMYP